MNYIEYGISRIFAGAKGRDARLFTKGAAFAQLTSPTLTLDCPEVGASGSQMPADLSADGAGRFPTLSWAAATPAVKEYLLISEDPDAPLPSPIIHGIYYGIPASVTGVSAVDFETAEGEFMLKGGFKYGKNRRGNVYIPPSSAAGEPIDATALSPLPTAEEVGKEIEGKVVGWGEWVGSYERQWK
ncbi:uncharacterized protein N7482_003364 [Penicillium canariense]|uniref:Uncharacterized protein n=1 Tax=Penicillium canariense TaxID=189055 RepID=A0A9W9LP88_9EURO|nr:uncharacterized protein N7482_003364 [Penicillium canariense]KAJ5167770.1 hypothetical protein N7482_003364 [Penicillium canariense]